MDNYIKGEINIEEEDINKDIRIINSSEEAHYKRNKIPFTNINEITSYCEISINNVKIDFSYFHKFEKPGKYEIVYSFSKLLTNTNYMFYGCDKLISLDCSNFKTEKVIEMIGMFYGCKSLKSLNVSTFNTTNVKDMDLMFSSCESLIELDLSSFHTPNLTESILGMFYQCKSLKKLNLANFYAEKVKDYEDLLFGCISLKKENLICNDQKVLSSLN